VPNLYREARADVTPNLPAGSLMSITSNLAFFRGEDVTVTFTMNPPADITGWTLTFTVRDKLGGTSQFSKTVGSGITLTIPTRGVFQVAIASADTSGLAVGRYVWDVRREDSGNKTTLADGYIDLRQEVTA
jgi:hypothetical protein